MHDLTDRSSTLALLERYDRPGPRYTSYPTAVEFHEGVGEGQYRERLALANADSLAPLSAYIHLPFCEHRCGFCGCNVIITRHRDVAAKYLDYLEKEIDLLAGALPDRRKIAQMHWGGGTPTYYEADQLGRIFDSLHRRFTFTDDAEIGVEIDPRVTHVAHLHRLRALGFNRLSMGVQDFAPEVQRAVNREQSYELTRDLMVEARAAGFASINIDLIYGLPLQTVDGFRRTLERSLTLRPDRVAVYSFAFVPWMRAHMKSLPDESLPSPELKLELLALAIDAFTGAGYRQIGMDHFALPEDELAMAVERRDLHRNFMGYTVQKTRDMVALGVSGIGEVQGAFVQNTKKLNEYYAALDHGRFPVERGYEMQPDDLIRREVIAGLMCNFSVSRKEIEERFGIVFGDYFAPELHELTTADSATTDGLVTVDDSEVAVTPLGRLFVRNVCMVFDRYLRGRLAGTAPIFSRTV
ncbi:MAG: oxygen-independent coproporphyrinogen III oxidase [Vicinamibacteria bacterium]|nr:oxygen-independent coproporphyrinogen III oxidase [Vicinamibacteria bacterium]